jgi:hypothetical protein
MLRYRETGQVHADFHRTINGTLAYLRSTYGLAMVDEVLRRTAHDVYRAIRADLMAGTPEHWLEHWTYFLRREGGWFNVTREGATIRIHVHRCPAAAYLKQRGIALDEAFRRQTTVLNAALAEGTPFEILTEPIDDLRYTMTLRRRAV